MSEPADSAPEQPEPVEGELVAEARPLPRSSEPTTLEVPGVGSVPATVVAATGGFLLGVASFVLMRILRRPSAARSLARRRKRLTGRRSGVDVESTRSFLVDVHLLKR